MAQVTKIPRIYVNTLAYLNALGLAEGNLIQGGYMHLNPTKTKMWGANGNNDTRVFKTNTQINNFFGEKSFIALLGHNLHSAGAFVRVQGFEKDASPSNYDEAYEFSDLINDRHQTGNTIYPDGNDGFSMSTFDGRSISNDKNSISIRLDGTGGSYTIHPQINSAFLGTYYDFPHAADVSVKMEYSYDGVKNVTSRGGSTLSNATYLKPADWGDGGAWQLGSDADGNPVDNLRMGRRSWSVNFTYLTEDDIMAKVAATSNAGSSFEDGQNPNENTLLDGTDFISQVWNRTLGHHLPFIFQADNTNNNPDQFCIARFDQNSLVVNQTAPNLYSISLKVVETY